MPIGQGNDSQAKTRNMTRCVHDLLLFIKQVIRVSGTVIHCLCVFQGYPMAVGTHPVLIAVFS